MKEILTTCFVLAYSTFSMMADSAATIVKTTNIAEEETEVEVTCYDMATLIYFMKEGEDDWIYMISIENADYEIYEGHIITCEVLE